MMWTLLLGCADPGDELARLRVADADLDNISMNTFAVIGGGITGNATLQVVDDQGTLWSFPVTLRGATAGAVVEFSRTMDFGSYRALELPDQDLTGDQLLGTYRGSGAGLALVAGGTGMDLVNPHDVVLDRSLLVMGVSAYAGSDWVNIQLGGTGGEDYDFVWEDSGDPGDTNDTAWDTSGPDDTGADSVSDSGPEPRDTAGPVDLDELGGGLGCACDEGLGDPLGCGCGGGGAPASGLGVLVWLLLRRRRR
jgi:uncharacterized protein (TIGR03382 family)